MALLPVTEVCDALLAALALSLFDDVAVRVA